MKTCEDRRRETAQMHKCACGNVAKLGSPRCGACENLDNVRTELILCDTVADLRAFIAAHLM